MGTVQSRSRAIIDSCIAELEAAVLLSYCSQQGLNVVNLVNADFVCVCAQELAWLYESSQV